MRTISRPRVDEATKNRIMKALWSAALALLGGSYIIAFVFWVLGLLGARYFPQPWHFLIGFYAVFGLGFALIYNLVYFFRDLMPGFVARVLWTLGALAHGTGTALDLRADGYTERPMRRNGKGVDHTWEVYRDGKWVEIPRGAKHLVRLGLRPFGITFENTEVLLEPWLANFDPDTFDGEAVADGGEFYLLGEKGGHRRFVPVSWVEGDVDGHVLSHDAVYDTLRRAAGTEMSDKAYEESLIKSSKNREMGNIVMVGYVITMCLLFGLMGMMIFG